MNYTKPQILPTGPALDAIQAQEKVGAQADTVTMGGKPSNAAYEADE